MIYFCVRGFTIRECMVWYTQVNEKTIFNFSQEPSNEKVVWGMCVDWRIILKYISKKCGVRLWTAFIWHRIRCCGRLVWTW